MNINEKIVSTKTQLLDIIKQEVNVLDYVKEERANVLFKPVGIASEKTAKEVFEKLNERLSKI